MHLLENVLVFHRTNTEFIRSGKVRMKSAFLDLVMESQGKSGNVREFFLLVREIEKKAREVFLSIKAFSIFLNF